MKPELHPAAAKNFNEKARALLAKVAPETEQRPSDPPTHMLRPGAPVAFEYTEKDFVDFKITGQTDQLGNTTARYFEHEGRRFGFEDEKYKQLARIAEGIQKTEAFREVVSNRWVEDAILDWIKAKYAGANSAELADFLAERCEAEVKEYERFVHHGHTIDELETVRSFMLDVWVLFLELAKSSRRFDTKEQFVDHLEAMKLA